MDDTDWLGLLAMSPGILYVGALVVYAFWQTLIGSKCPKCGSRHTFECYSEAGDTYPAPTPSYYRCSRCGVRLSRIRIRGQGWQDASGHEFDRNYTPWMPDYTKDMMIRGYPTCLMLRGDHSQAARRLSRGIVKHREDADLRYRLALALDCLGRTSEAIASLNAYVQLATGDPAEEARLPVVAAFLRDLTDRPLDPASRRLHAAALFEIGDRDGAVVAMQRYLELARHDDPAGSADVQSARDFVERYGPHPIFPAD